MNKKRSREKSTAQFLPAAAAVTVAGFLFGGAGAAIHFSPASNDTDLSVKYDPADLPPPDRNAQADRVSRTDDRSEIPAPIEVAANGVAGVPGIPGIQPRTVAPAAGSDQAGSAVTDSTVDSMAVLSDGACVASYFDRAKLTASGEQASPEGFTAANPDLPFNSLVRVTNPANGQSVVVRINDRGPFYGQNRCLDLSESAFSSIASVGEGVVDVRYEVLTQDAT